MKHHEPDTRSAAKTIRLLALFAILFLPNATVLAGNHDGEAIISPIDVQAGDNPTSGGFGDVFGDHVAEWNNFVFVGAPREHSIRPENDGAVYVYRRRGELEFFQKLLPQGNAEFLGDRFGSGVTARGGWLFIGVANDQSFPGQIDPGNPLFPDDPPFTFAGKVYVYQYHHGEWNKMQELSSPQPITSGGFGSRTDSSHVALNEHGTLAAIGESANAGVRGVHIYRLCEDGTESEDGPWCLIQTIFPPAEDDVSRFGDEIVYLGDDHFLVGAETALPDGSGVLQLLGRAYVYGPDGPGLSPVPKQRLDAPSGFVPDEPCFGLTFGDTGMAASNGTVVIADSCEDERAGALYVYHFRGNSEPPLQLEARIGHPDGTADDRLGSNFASGGQTVSTDGRHILAGTPLGGGGGFFGGEGGGDVFLFERFKKGWALSGRLESGLPLEERLWYGQSVTLLRGNLSSVAEVDGFGAGGVTPGGKLFLYHTKSGGNKNTGSE
jgi:hypothetical protein